MFNLGFYRKLRKIEKEIRKNNKLYDEAVAKEKKGKNLPQTLQELAQEFAQHHFELESQKMQLLKFRYLMDTPLASGKLYPLFRETSVITRQLISQIDRLLLPRPDRQNKQYWESSYDDSSKNLTNEGITYARSLIRKEQKDRLETFSFWMVTITGMIGALTGLFAILFNK
ncbi:MAG: hypothetical protein V1933_02595 [Candidatus Omnitrophota bacterium]